jgi:hypothetical protein
MITEDYVSFETAKLLKEKGFDEYCGYYSSDGEYWGYCVYNHMGKDYISAPTLQMAMKWLREEHHWHIFVVPRWEDVEYMPGEWEEEMVGYQYVILAVGEVNRKNEQPIVKALTSESAYEAAIKYCLENLI